ncbi:Tol-Pal system beta propeller repeat protein TolB [Isoalcanivorax beigongshangi]|uniref:Tol-Pal system protein TolB n=1 Tax=Isoalcanivorax beigongshangi TaxID=3238810 RepID=A0ABV4AIN9_9GAMM
MKKWFLAAWLTVLTSLAQANLVIEITQGRDDAMPLAIVPFAVDGAPPAEDVAGIVAADLHRSGQFAPIEPRDLLSRPGRGQDIIWRDFRVMKSDYVLLGRVLPQPDKNYRIEYELHDVSREAQVLAAHYTATPDQLRDVAHSIADKVFEQLTGIQGAFSTKLLYVTMNERDRFPFQLQYADADGHRVNTILRSREPIMSPSWSPDGSRVAYVSFEGDGLPKIYVHQLATSERRVVSQGQGINGAPAWSPDGTRLAMTLSRDGTPQIYTLDLHSGALTRQTRSNAIDTEPRWLPDGQSLIFTSNRGGGPQIYRLNLRDGTARRLTFEGSYNARADITPDGRHLVFVHRNGGQFRIGVQDLKRGTFNVVTGSNMDESPSVAPNGTMIIYGTQSDGKGVLEAVSIDGRVKVRLPSREGEVREPAWSPFL